MLKKLLSGNRRFAQNAFLKDNQYYRAIARKQKPEILWIRCSDSRVSESIITDSKPGKTSLTC
jgi:carbonic anhydrase